MVLSLMFSSSAYAQRNFTEEADNAFEMKMYYEAIDLYKKAYSKTSNRVEKRRMLFRIAESYRLTNNIWQAEYAYLRAIRAKYSDPVVYLRYAQVLKSREKYEDAIKQYKIYKEKVPDDPRGEKGIESCKQAKDWQDNPTRYEVEADRRINDRESDFAPMYADRKYNTVIFTSSRNEATGKTDPNTGQTYSDLFIIEQDQRGNWSRADLIDKDEVINTKMNEGAVSFDRRFITMYFTRCPMEKGKILSCKIYSTKKRGRTWSDPELVPLGPDTFTYGHPAISGDERTIIFASDMDGGHGGLDLWMATRRSAHRPFGEPVNLGPVINTEDDEMYPYLREDDHLYFASNGHVGLGGLDIYHSRKVDENWTEPENMKVPINSHMDDFGITFNKDQRSLEDNKAEEMGFFSTNRRGGRGEDDIWHFRLPEIVFTLSGTVRDEETLQPIADATVTKVGSDGTTVETKTGSNGSYSFNKRQMNKETSYEITVIKNDYFQQDKKETTVGLMASKDLVLNFRLKPIPEDPIPLPEIRFDLGDWKLLDIYKDSLNGLIKTMEENPRLVVELGSHTDFRADEDFNDTLSLKRAKSIVDYLVKKGIDRARLVPKGYGERMPRKLDKDITVNGITFEKGTRLTERYINNLPSTRHKEAAHQLNRRTTFKILRNDYVPTKSAVEPLDSIGFGGIALRPQENMVKLKAKDNAYTFPIIVNRNELTASYIKNTDAIYLSYDKAMEFLSQAIITVRDFTEGEDAIKEDGSIVENAEVTIKSVRIANREMENVRMIVTYDQQPHIIIGDAGLKQFGEFRIDEEMDMLIFKEIEETEEEEN